MPEGLNNSEQPQAAQNNLSRSQKVLVAGLAFFGVVVIILWGVQFNRSINAPFAYDESNTGTDTTDQVAADEAALRAKDTDTDGLSDWDETNIYRTSPYLEDSDSDGIPDGTEIKNGTDPNCPAGRDCTGALQTASSTVDQSLIDSATQNLDNSTLNSLLNQLDSGNLTLPDTALPAATSPELQAILDGTVDAATLRQMLLSAGMDKTLLDKISDQELLKTYQDSLKKQ